MSKAGFLILLGFIILTVPFLGVPVVAKTALMLVAGLLIMALGFLVREERRLLMRALQGDHSTDAYTENSAKGYAESRTVASSE
jgi:hypothetical protein